MLKSNNKKAFTLVELIVVITILAILWTIAFLSFQGYSVSARNSARVSDLNNINKALTLNQLRTWKFILPTTWVQITYSGSEVRIQWSFWEDTRLKLWDRWAMSKVPVDPLTQNEYTYSVLNTRTEISIAAVMEWEYGFNDNLLLDKTYAAWIDWSTYIVWNYNWRIAKVSSWTTTYVLAVPTIISWDIGLTDIIDLINSRKLAFNYSWVLPSTYTEWVFNNNLPTTDIVNVSDILVFSWSIETLTDSIEQEIFINNLKDAYNWTAVSNLSQIDEIINSTDSSLLAQNIIKENILPNLEIVLNANNTNNEWSNPNTAFISTWDTSKTSYWTTNDNQIKLPLQSDWIYDFVVDWWDWNTNHITAYDQAEVTHTYANIWVYDVTITWQLEWFAFNSSGDKTKILDVKSWWPDFKFWNNGRYFSWCSNLTWFTATDTPNLDGTTDMSYMFYVAKVFNQDISSWNISNITNMRGMFYWASSFNQDISSWDVSNVTNMGYMFTLAESFNQPLNSWNVSNVTDMSNMFKWTDVFNQPLNSWNVSNVTNMSNMFNWAIVFNQPLNSWNVSNVSDMSYMFYHSNIFNQPLDSWNVSSVNNMSNMFNWAIVFNQPLNTWDVSSVTNMRSMFNWADSFNQPLDSWNVSSVTSMYGMFSWADSFNQQLDSWDVSSVTSMKKMFFWADSFNQPLDSWDVSSVTDMSYMFSWADSFNQPLDSWGISSVTDISSMFSWADSFNQPLNNWDTSSITNTSDMFLSATAFNQDISSWDVSNVTNMYRMFQWASLFDQDISSWNVNNVTNHTDFDKDTSSSWTDAEKPNFP